jgi:hypothetical protein
MTMTTATDIHQAGTRVEATYCGGTFTGTIQSYRHHTINHTAVEYHITPDGPFETAIGTLDRDTILVYATWDGEPCDYDQFEGQVKALDA